MQFLNKIPDINTFFILEDGIYAFERGIGLLKKYVEGVVKWTCSPNTQHVLIEIDKETILTYWHGTRAVFIRRKNGEIVFELEESFTPQKRVNNQIHGYCRIKSVNGEKQYNISRLSPNGKMEEVINTADFFINQVTDDIYLLHKGWNNYRAISISTKQNLWQVDLTSFFKHDGVFSPIHGIIEHQGKLFFSLGNLHRSGVYVLDALTGKLLFQTEEIGGPFKLANDLLYDFNGEVLNIFDPITFDYVQKDFTDLLKSGNLRYVYHGVYQNMAIEGNLLYYASLYGDRDANYTQIALVVLDIEKVELVEVIPFPSDGGAIIDVQVHQNRLFALTTSDVLHVFER